jgi:hypothetical protein
MTFAEIATPSKDPGLPINLGVMLGQPLNWKVFADTLLKLSDLPANFLSSVSLSLLESASGVGSGRRGDFPASSDSYDSTAEVLVAPDTSPAPFINKRV